MAYVLADRLSRRYSSVDPGLADGGFRARRVVFVRRVRTAPGATAVQIAEHVDGRQRIVTHAGSAHSQAALGFLLARARQLLQPTGQDASDLGLEPHRR